MTTVRAQCPECGDVQLEISDLTVRTSGDHPGTYHFRCPVCRQLVSRAASRRIVDLLVASGAPTEPWSWPAEMSERHDGPVLTPDDLLDFHLLLERPDWFDDLAALVPPAGSE